MRSNTKFWLFRVQFFDADFAVNAAFDADFADNADRSFVLSFFRSFALTPYRLITLSPYRLIALSPRRLVAGHVCWEKGIHHRLLRFAQIIYRKFPVEWRKGKPWRGDISGVQFLDADFVDVRWSFFGSIVGRNPEGSGCSKKLRNQRSLVFRHLPSRNLTLEGPPLSDASRSRLCFRIWCPPCHWDRLASIRRSGLKCTRCRPAEAMGSQTITTRSPQPSQRAAYNHHNPHRRPPC